MKKFFDKIPFIGSKSSSPTAENGTPGFSVYGGYVQSHERDQRLVGKEKYRTFGNMVANTTIIAAGTRYFLNLVGGADWSVTPANDSDEAKEKAELVEKMIHDMDSSWNSVTRRASMYRFHGFSIQEMVAKRGEDGSLVMKNVKARPQETIERWDTNKHGDVLGVLQRSKQDSEEIYLKRDKIVYLVDDTLNDTPEGMGIFRHITKRSEELKSLEQLEGFGYAGDLRGIPVAKIPYAALNQAVESGNLSATDRDTMVHAMEKLVTEHVKADANMGISIDSAHYTNEVGDGETASNAPMWDFSLLEGSSQGLDEVAKAIDRKNYEMAIVLGVDHLLIGKESGSRALGESKNNNFAQIVNAALIDLAAAFNRDYLGFIWRINGWDDKLKPKLSPEKLRGNDVERVMTGLAEMARAGAPIMPDDPVVDALRRWQGLPETTPETLVTDAGLRSRTSAAGGMSNEEGGNAPKKDNGVEE